MHATPLLQVSLVVGVRPQQRQQHRLLEQSPQSSVAGFLLWLPREIRSLSRTSAFSIPLKQKRREHVIFEKDCGPQHHQKRSGPVSGESNTVAVKVSFWDSFGRASVGKVAGGNGLLGNGEPPEKAPPHEEPPAWTRTPQKRSDFNDSRFLWMHAEGTTSVSEAGDHCGEADAWHHMARSEIFIG